jgi:alanine-alpha-ketoisovalerate/valine-pyruvate aminotransferase
MQAYFRIREATNGVELNFVIKGRGELLKWLWFEDIAAAKAFVKVLKRKCTKKYFFALGQEKAHYFVLIEKFKIILCCSHNYSSAQKARDGFALLCRHIRKAKVMGLVEL